jgi:hypothetical protein
MRCTRSPDLQPAEEEEEEDSNQDLNITEVGCEEAGTSLPYLCRLSSLSRLQGPCCCTSRARARALARAFWQHLSLRPLYRLCVDEHAWYVCHMFGCVHPYPSPSVLPYFKGSPGNEKAGTRVGEGKQSSTHITRRTMHPHCAQRMHTNCRRESLSCSSLRQHTLLDGAGGPPSQHM